MKHRLTKNRLMCGSFVHQPKELGWGHTSHLPDKTLPLTLCQAKPWNRQGKPKLSICTTYNPPCHPSKYPKWDCQVQSHKGSDRKNKYPIETWVQIYTDGMMQAVSNEGAVSIYYPKGQIELLAILTGKHCSNNSAEVQAFEIAATAIPTASSDNHQLMFLTDALAMLKALSNKEPQLMDAFIIHSQHKKGCSTVGACSLWCPWKWGCWSPCKDWG